MNREVIQKSFLLFCENWKKYLDDVYCFVETLSARFYNESSWKVVLEKFNDAAPGLFIVYCQSPESWWISHHGNVNKARAEKGFSERTWDSFVCLFHFNLRKQFILPVHKAPRKFQDVSFVLATNKILTKISLFMFTTMKNEAKQRESFTLFSRNIFIFIFWKLQRR